LIFIYFFIGGRETVMSSWIFYQLVSLAEYSIPVQGKQEAKIVGVENLLNCRVKAGNFLLPGTFRGVVAFVT